HRGFDAVDRHRRRLVPIGELIADRDVEPTTRLGEGHIVADEAPGGGERETAESEMTGGRDGRERDLAIPLQDTAADQRRGNRVWTSATRQRGDVVELDVDRMHRRGVRLAA